ncbi:MAG: hydroxyacid dehydrogenase, partial [Bacteroidales bacterium]|nr:hydroxyacid dehydrogenase [Bacteroidales bacterium]
GLIGARELGLMKPGAYLVNLGRGAVVDEIALAEAIDKGRIAGAALDVFSTEPLPECHPLLHTSHPERLRFTPHIAWASHESLDRLVRMMTDNIRETMCV